MAEYIIRTESPAMWEAKERIVRCRDCYYRNSAWTLQKDGCHAREMDCYGVDPEGFCAWGKRSER